MVADWLGVGVGVCISILFVLGVRVGRLVLVGLQVLVGFGVLLGICVLVGFGVGLDITVMLGVVVKFWNGYPEKDCKGVKRITRNDGIFHPTDRW